MRLARTTQGRGGGAMVLAVAAAVAVLALPTRSLTGGPATKAARPDQQVHGAMAARIGLLLGRPGLAGPARGARQTNDTQA